MHAQVTQLQSVVVVAFFIMKRALEEDYYSYWPLRPRKIALTASYRDGCPYCGASHLSYKEWSSFGTVPNPRETYELCSTCMQKWMGKHFQIVSWWRWSPEGGSQEHFATSPCFPINSLR